jgi:hypothetical protein
VHLLDALVELFFDCCNVLFHLSKVIVNLFEYLRPLLLDSMQVFEVPDSVLQEISPLIELVHSTPLLIHFFNHGVEEVMHHLASLGLQSKEI